MQQIFETLARGLQDAPRIMFHDFPMFAHMPWLAWAGAAFGCAAVMMIVAALDKGD